MLQYIIGVIRDVFENTTCTYSFWRNFRKDEVKKIV